MRRLLFYEPAAMANLRALPRPYNPPAMRALVLGSSSPYRRELLARLGLDFAVDPPGIDETPRAGETAPAYVRRLALAKAREVGARHPDALVISSDQCAELDGALLGKPLTHERARAQLRRLSGRAAVFRTGLCLLDAAAGAPRYREAAHTVEYRELAESEIEDYLRRERPYRCTAGFRSEGLGPTLTRRIRGDDPSALIGLPMALLTELLREAGVAVAPPPDAA